MWLMNHARETVGTLSTDERELLVGFLSGQQLINEEQRANGLLRRIRTNKHFLGCECSKPTPLLNVALMDSGRLVLRNNPEGATHAQLCPFSHDAIKNKGAAAPVSHTVDRIGDELKLQLHSEFKKPKEPGQQSEARAGSATGVRKPKKLVSLLLTMAERASLAIYRPGSTKSVTEQYAAIRDGVASFTLSPGLPLANYLDTKLSGKRLISMSMRLKGSQAFGEHRRVGLLLDCVRGVSGRTIEVTTTESVDFFGHVERSVPSSFPALALATVTTQQDKPNFYEMGNVATLPVLSTTCFFPVTGDRDRECVASVFGLLDWFHKTKGIEVNAVRHLFAHDGGALLELRSTRLSLIVDFTTVLSANEAPPATIQEILHLADFDSLDKLKKAITKRFLSAHSG